METTPLGASLGVASVLRDAGQFAQALKALNETTLAADERLPADVLRAELLERVGRYSQSLALAEAVLRRPQLSGTDRSTCELVLARLQVERGDIDRAVAGLQRSVAHAADAGDAERLCWAELRLLLLLSDRSGPDSIAPLLSELRTHVMRAGHPALMAALHIHVAETEAKRGLLHNARRHLQLGKRGLTATANRWLEALAENVECGIETMRSDFAAASAHASRCLALSEEAGAASVRESALGNLGHLAYLAARFDEAAAYLHRADVAQRGSDVWAACMDTLARVSLAQGRLDECARLLDAIDASVPAKSARYAYRYAQLTRIQLRARQGELEGAVRQAQVVRALAAESRDELLQTLTQLIMAELLEESGRLSDCAALLCDLAPALPHQAPDFLAQYERVVACALARDGRVEAAWTHRRRAERIYVGLQHEAGRLELARCWEEATARAGGANGASVDGRADPAAVMLGDVASLMQHAGRPELIARDIVSLLGAVSCIRYAAAVARGDDGTTMPLAHAGDARGLAASAERRLPVGRAGDRSIELVVGPGPGVEAVAAINAVVLLLATLRGLESDRAAREAHATLWPVDELPTDRDGAVTIGHMREVMALAKRVANANVSVLVTGESGTGKEVVARAIHAHSSRAHKPFIPFNCTAVPREMLESQLFGHRRGAFTGADRDNPGVIRSARDGTLFLDEIGELSLDLQPKLLRFLESGEICPLGESTPFIVNVRVVAATNARLERLVREGRFREDLFYRLNVIRLSIRPLRERRDEIPMLAGHFLARAGEEFGKGHIRMAEETMERLVLHPWPGNVRQLQNEIRRMVALAEPGSVLRPEALSRDSVDDGWAAAAPRATGTSWTVAPSLVEKLNPALSKIEREMIRAALDDHHGRVDAAAKALGISRKGLYLKRRRLGL